MDPMLAHCKNSGVKMNGGTEVRKPMRARKTMTPSSRRQIKMLNKMKKGVEMAPNGASGQDKDLCVTNSDVNQFLNAGALQDILYSWYETEPSSLPSKPVEVHLNAEPAGYTSDPSEARLSGSPCAGDTPSSSTGTNNGGMALEQESTDFRFHEKNTTAFVPDNPPRKRTPGDSSKRKRTPEEDGEGCQRSSDQRQSGLGKIKGFIQEQMVASMRTWDHQLQHLHERIDHTQCLRKHERISITIVKRISRVERHVIALRKKELPSRVNLPGVGSENKILNCPAIPPGDKSSESRPSEKGPSGPREKPPETTKERNDDVICLDEVNENPGAAALNPPAVQEEETASNTDVATPSASKNLVIDLTDEKSNPDTVLIGNDAETGAARTSNSAAESQKPNSPELELQPSNQADKEDFSQLPPLPKSPIHQEPVAGFRNTLPPLKLDLSVVRVENPKGIALQWNVQRADPRCAPLESFHLFLFLKGSQLRSWQETNQILAKKLPMACTLTGFPESSRCYLAMRAKDIYGRYGPFSDIQSVLTL